MTPTLYLIPSPLGEEFHPDAFPNEIKSIIEKLDYFIIENEKEARRFIKKITPDKKQSTLKLYPLNKHTSADEMASYLDPCLKGNDMGLIWLGGVLIRRALIGFLGASIIRVSQTCNPMNQLK